MKTSMDRTTAGYEKGDMGCTAGVGSNWKQQSFFAILGNQIRLVAFLTNLGNPLTLLRTLKASDDRDRDL